jgi:hypothetical protein
MKEERIPAPQFHDVRPIPYQAVRVWLSDGTRVLGMWTGERWWSAKGEIHPVNWELEVREKKTKKLRESLPESEGKGLAQEWK